MVDGMFIFTLRSSEHGPIWLQHQSLYVPSR